MTEAPKPLKRAIPPLYHYADGKRRNGPNPKMSGDYTDLLGDCTNLWGDCTDLLGDCTGLRGNCSGLVGNLSAIPASARPCDISDWVAS